MTHDFIINTEEVNEYGYRVLTDGIDYTQYMRNPVVLFMHEREYHKNDNNKGKAVIGRAVSMRKENSNLIASIEFDEADEFAKAIAGKVERGFIRMASIYADPKQTSSETELILSGQIYETVTKCKLEEISIVDIGGNDGALKLNKEVGSPIALNKLKLLDMSTFKTIALALGLTADASEEVILQKIKEVELAKSQAETEVSALKANIQGIQEAEATQLVDKAIKLGLLHEDFKDTYLKGFNSDFENQKVKLTKLIGDKENPEGNGNPQTVVREIVLGSKSTSDKKEVEESYDYLQKKNPVKLAKIRNEQPAEYERLAKEYQAGVRYSE